MKRKQQFLRAIKILAPNDSFIHRLAQCVPEDTLPLLPGGAALEFVVAMAKLTRPGATSPIPHHNPCRTTATCSPQTKACSHETSERGLLLKDALRVKSAEYWLKLGHPAQALHELEALPKSAQKVPWAVKVHLAATHAAGESCITRAE